MTAAMVVRRAPLGALFLAIVVAGVAGCGGNGGGQGNPPAARKWAGTFCRSFSSYERDVADLSNQFNERVRAMPAGDLAARKSALVEYLSGSITRTDDFLRALKGAGEPEVPDGGDLVGSISESFRDLRSTFADAQGDAERLSETDPVAFATTVQQITGLISTGSNRTREAIFRARTRYETRALDRAFDRAPACRTVR